MEETFPAIKKRADQEVAAIYFADEAYSRTDHHAAPLGRRWGRLPSRNISGRVKE